MSCVSYGAVFSRLREHVADLAKIDGILAGRADELARTRKGRAWRYRRGPVWLDVRVEQVEKVLWDCEDDLLSLGLLPETGRYRVAFVAHYCGGDADREIEGLIGIVAAVIDGFAIGPRHSS